MSFMTTSEIYIKHSKILDEEMSGTHHKSLSEVISGKVRYKNDKSEHYRISMSVPSSTCFLVDSSSTLTTLSC